MSVFEAWHSHSTRSSEVRTGCTVCIGIPQALDALQTPCPEADAPSSLQRQANGMLVLVSDADTYCRT